LHWRCAPAQCQWVERRERGAPGSTGLSFRRKPEPRRAAWARAYPGLRRVTKQGGQTMAWKRRPTVGGGAEPNGWHKGPGFFR
jgi:hypothetical protein